MLAIKRAPPPPPPSCLVDPHWNNVMLFLNGEGSNGSTPVDLSKNEYTATLGNGINWDDATVTTSEKRFGNGSISFPTTSTRVRFDVADLNVAEDEELTIDFWIRLDDLPWSSSGGSVVGSSTGFFEGKTAFSIVITVTGGLSFQLGTSTAVFSFSQAVQPATWTHLAFVRRLLDPETAAIRGAPGTISAYVNGELYTGQDATTELLAINAPDINIGQVPSTVSGTSNGIQGHIDEFRITKGVARYTGASFTLPAAPSCIGA
jgi:hypothetical protein